MNRSLPEIGTALLVWAVALSLAACERPSNEDVRQEFGNRAFETNGERIYFTGQSGQGRPITFEMMGAMHMRPGHLACADCHGPEGHGGTIRMMMFSFEAPDIRFDTLTAPGHVHEEEEESMDHAPYTVETIKRAITRGLDPGGRPLNEFMPRWRMSDEDLSDLLDFLRRLDGNESRS